MVKLQSGNDRDTQRLWDELMELSKAYLRDTYAVLRVALTDDDIRGESFYNDMLAEVADDLVAKGLAWVSDGALCAFPPGFENRDGTPLPLIIRKSDGGYNYATTDLATIRYRVEKLHADRALYVVGTDQALHFKMVFAVAQTGRLATGQRRLRARPDRHGAGQGRPSAADQGGRQRHAERSDRRGAAAGPRAPRRGRAGRDGPRPRRDRPGHRHRRDQVRRPVDRAGERLHLRLGPDDLLQGEHRPLPAVRDHQDQVDLPPGRDRQAALRGPIAVAGARRAGAGQEAARVRRRSSRQVAESAEPHRLCAYLFEVASLFTSFYEQCPVLKADDEETRDSRLALCAAALRVLTAGLGLLGVPIPDRM